MLHNNLHEGEEKICVEFRWNKPERDNGVLTHFRVYYQQLCQNDTADTLMEWNVSNVKHNVLLFSLRDVLPHLTVRFQVWKITELISDVVHAASCVCLGLGARVCGFCFWNCWLTDSPLDPWLNLSICCIAHYIKWETILQYYTGLLRLKRNFSKGLPKPLLKTTSSTQILLSWWRVTDQ